LVQISFVLSGTMCLKKNLCNYYCPEKEMNN